MWAILYREVSPTGIELLTACSLRMRLMQESTDGPFACCTMAVRANAKPWRAPWRFEASPRTRRCSVYVCRWQDCHSDRVPIDKPHPSSIGPDLNHILSQEPHHEG